MLLSERHDAGKTPGQAYMLYASLFLDWSDIFVQVVVVRLKRIDMVEGAGNRLTDAARKRGNVAAAILPARRRTAL